MGEAGNIADKCGYDQPAWSCVSASLSFSKTISANIASAIPGIVQSCQSYSGEKVKGKRAVDKSKIIRGKEQWRKAVEQKRQSAKKARPCMRVRCQPSLDTAWAVSS